MWYWKITWEGEDGEIQTITSERGWRTMQEAYEVVASISEYIQLKLYDMGAVGECDFEIVYNPKGGD